MFSFQKKIVYFLCIVNLILTAPITQAAAPPVPASVQNISADAAILINAETGEVLYEKNADKREYPASLTKMMTCILSLESNQPDRNIIISRNAANVESASVTPGYRLRLIDLTRQMMMISDNGAARAIAETLGGSLPQFAEQMNMKAAELGAVNTHFVNPSGMPDKNHYSTARDLAKIASYGMKNPAFRQIAGTSRRTVYYIEPTGYKIFCENTNELLDSYTGSTGIKTGWTRAAAGCLTASAKRNGSELIAIVLHSQTYDTRFTEAAALLDYGFSFCNN